MKQSEVVKLSTEELREELGKSKRAYTDIKMAHAISPLENPMQIKTMRKSVARIATELTKREME